MDAALGRILEELLGKGRLRVKRNPALAWCAASAVHMADPKGNRVYDKRKSTGRIDGLVALAMAAGLADSSRAAAGDLLAIHVL